MVAWQHTPEKEWAALHFGTTKVETNAGQHVFEVEVYLQELDPSAARVELYGAGVDGGGAVRQEMERISPLAGGSNGYMYRTRVSADRPATEYTARVITSSDGVAVPLEAAHIAWQR